MSSRLAPLLGRRPCFWMSHEAVDLVVSSVQLAASVPVSLPSLPSLAQAQLSLSALLPRTAAPPAAMSTIKARRPLLDNRTTDVLSGSVRARARARP